MDNPQTSGNAGFFILATGHYGAQNIEVHIRLRSSQPDKQLMELNALMVAITHEAQALHERLTPTVSNGDLRIVRP
jgi:hypothetical protein